MKTLILALRNLSRQKRRSATIAVAIAFCFGISIALGALAKGTGTVALDYIAQQMGGHIFINLDHQEKDSDGKNRTISIIRDQGELQSILVNLGVEKANIAFRSSAWGELLVPNTSDNQGISVALNGLDDQGLAQLAPHITMQEGNFSELLSGTQLLIISDKVAEKLGIGLNDALLFSTNTYKGQRTVVDVVIGGIFKSQGTFDSNEAYIAQGTVSTIIGLPTGTSSMCVVRVPNQGDFTLLKGLIADELNKHYVKTEESNVWLFNQVFMRNDLVADETKRQTWEGDRYLVQDLLDTGANVIDSATGFIRAGSLLILVLILLVTVMGLGNNFRMIILERTREIGTLRAMGMQKQAVIALFSTEGALLLLISMIAGAGLAAIIILVVSNIYISVPEYTQVMFLNNQIHFQIDPLYSVITGLIIILSVVGAVFFAAFKASKVAPAEALRESP